MTIPESLSDWFSKQVTFRRALLLILWAVGLALVFSEGIAAQLGADSSGIDATLQSLKGRVGAAELEWNDQIRKEIEDVLQQYSDIRGGWHIPLLRVGLGLLALATCGTAIEFFAPERSRKDRRERDDLWETGFRKSLEDADGMGQIKRLLTVLSRELRVRTGAGRKAKFWIKIAEWNPGSETFIVTTCSDETPQAELAYNLKEGEGGFGNYVRDVRQCVNESIPAFPGRYYTRESIRERTPERLRSKLEKSPIKGELCLPILSYVASGDKEPELVGAEIGDGRVYMKGVACYCSNVKREANKLDTDEIASKLREWTMMFGTSMHIIDDGKNDLLIMKDIESVT